MTMLVVTRDGICQKVASRVWFMDEASFWKMRRGELLMTEHKRTGVSVKVLPH